MRKKAVKIIKARARLYLASGPRRSPEQELKAIYRRTPGRERQALLRRWLFEIRLRTSPNA